MKAKDAGKKVVVAVRATPNVYREGRPAFVWTRSVFYLTQVVGAVGGRVAKPFRHLFAVGITRFPELDRKVRRDMVDAAKAVMTAKAGVAERAVAEGLARAFNMPAAHVLEYGIVRQAHRELTDEPIAEAAVRKHVELGGKVASHPRAFAELVMNGPAKPEVGLAALTAACFKLRNEFKPQLEAEAEAVVKAYVDGGGKFVPRAKELAELVMAAEKPAVDFYTLAGACYKLIPGYRDKMRREEDAGIDAILAGRMGQSAGKSGVTIGDALRSDRRQDRHHKDKGHRRGDEDREDGRRGKHWKK
jgi:hypothetical protein